MLALKGVGRVDESKELCLEFLKNNNVNPFKIKSWEEMMSSDRIVPEKYDALILYFAMNLNGGLVQYSYKSKEPYFLDIIKEAIYERLCDKRIRGKTDVFSELVAVVAGDLAGEILKEDSTLISIFTSFIILGIMNVGIDSWCKYYEKTKEIEGKKND